jgi:myosin III
LLSCIRPNKDKIPNFFDTELVATQLKYTGVLETTKIRCSGYSIRILFSEFVKRYSILAYPIKSNLPETKETCIDLLNKLGFENWRVGKSKVFLKYYHAENLSQLCEEMSKKIVIIQSSIRKWLARRSYIKQKNYMCNAAITIQRCKIFFVFFF